MGRRKKKVEVSDKPNRTTVTFVGGYYDGKVMVVGARPKLYCRLAIPEWATYKYDEATQEYRYIGTEPVGFDEEFIAREWFGL